MMQLRCTALFSLLTLSSFAQTAQQSRPGGLPKQATALVQSLYHQVVLRHPDGPPRGADMNVFNPHIPQQVYAPQN